MKKNNTTRKQLFVVIKKTRSFAKKTEITTHSRQNTATANGTASSYPNAPSAGLDNIRLPAPQAGLSGAPASAASQPTPPATPPAATVPPLPKFNKPHAEAAAAPSAPPAQPSTASVPQPSLPSPAPAPVAAASTAEPEAAQEPTTPQFAPDYAAVGNQLSKLMSGMAAPLSRLAGTVPGLLSSASKSMTQAAKANSSVAAAKPASVEPKATAPEVNAAEAKPIEVKPIEVDVKVDTVAPVSPSAASTVASTSLPNGSTVSKPLTTVTWNPATTISSLQRKAKAESEGYCAKAVVNAIQAGGTKIERTPAAKDLGAKLIAAGFKPIFSMPRPSNEYDRSNLLPGDVVVLDGFNKDERKGIKKDHPYGHAAMYDGSKWISDFTQSGFYPGPDYRVALPGYTIYRMTATQAQINTSNPSQRGASVPKAPVSTPTVPVIRSAPQTTQASAASNTESNTSKTNSATAAQLSAPTDINSINEEKKNIEYTKYNYNLNSALKKQIEVSNKEHFRITIGDPNAKGGARDATIDEIRDYMDPEKQRIGDKIYQFLDLSAPAGVSEVDLDKVLQGQGVLAGKSSIFMKAAKDHGINEAYLVAHAILETGHGSSDLAKGSYEYNGRKVYNMFGIDAQTNNPKKAIKFAYDRGWFSVDEAIDGGAKYISNHYIHNKDKQNTLYNMRWNPSSPASHQYATSANWAPAQSRDIKAIIDTIPNVKLKFDIPEYKK
ncbi:N-acetylglucosaminidase [Dickeya fangzhongdai]|uniref:N-acetylglucosaminidase n=1 Tax=Dickeya fangzhongdai TaxID=1778540 RepID=UPI0023E43083|nr:N-acetylglucosaminidase [Dickeya fangzhongdai]WES88516.1 N-acetylglucosaminidase [Dickeya fangzhongdai]